MTLAAVSLLSVLTAGCQTTGNSALLPPPSKRQVDVGRDQRTRDLYLSVIVQLEQYEKYHAALAHIDEFDRIYGATPRSRGLRGDAWLALGEMTNAEKEYEAIAHGALAGLGHHGLGSVAAKREDWPRAITQFEEAVHEQPTNVQFLTDLSHAYAEFGRAKDAEFTLKKAMELSPSNTLDDMPPPDGTRQVSASNARAAINSELALSPTASSAVAPIAVESEPVAESTEAVQ